MGQNLLKGAAIITAGAIATGIVVDWGKRRVTDIQKNLTFFFDNFRIWGLVKDKDGKANGNLRVNFDFSFNNYSDTSLTVKNLFTTISYKKGSSWLPLGKSPVLVPVIDLPSKKTIAVKNIPIDFNLLEVVSANWKDLLAGKAFTIRTENSFSIYGVTTSAPPYDYEIKLSKDLLTRIAAMFTGKKGLGRTGAQVWAADLRLEVIPLRNSDITITPGEASGVPSGTPSTANHLQDRFRPQSIGLTAASRRKLKPGTEFNHLIKRSTTGQNKLVNPNATTDETLQEINKIVRETSWQVRDFVKQVLLKGKPSREEISNRLYRFIYEHIQYVEDEAGQEQLREPGRLWEDRQGDCDCFAIFISACLREAGVKHDFRVVKIKQRSYFQHIYVIVPRTAKDLTPYERKQKHLYTAVDPVWDYQDQDPAEISFVMDVKAM
jgi:hypothetical protein